MYADGAARLQAAHQPLSLPRGLRLPNLPTGNTTPIQHIGEVYGSVLYLYRTDHVIWQFPIFKGVSAFWLM
jgi:hypothetical protein